MHRYGSSGIPRIFSAAAPLPAAEATCLVLGAHTSPAARMPGTLVFQKPASRFSKPRG